MRTGLKLGGRTLFYYVVLILLCFLFVSISGNVFWLQVLLNVAILAGFGMLLLNDAGYRGERACTLGATLDKQREEGRHVDPEQERERWSVKNGLIGYFAAVIPLLIIALVNLAVLPLYPQTLEPVQEAEITDDQLFSAAYQKMMGEEGAPEASALPGEEGATPAPEITAPPESSPAPDGALGGGSEDVADYVFNRF